MRWAFDCAAHALRFLAGPPDERLTSALETADAWARGEASVGEARKASVAAHAAAREAADPVAVVVARSVGQAVATAHMADHSLGAAWYALKAARITGRSVDDERRWQDARLPDGIRDLVLSARESRRV